VTELEIQQALRNANSRALFYVRDPSVLSELPPEVVNDFVDTPEARKKLAQLKEQLVASKQKIYVYKSVWGGVREGKPLVVSEREKERERECVCVCVCARV
jgi:hypothetical protein